MICRCSILGRLSSWLMAWMMLFGDGAVLFAQETLLGQSHQSYTIFYQINRSDIDSAYRHNGSVLDEMGAELGRLLSDGQSTVDSVVIVSSSSPDGDARFNYHLSVKRGRSVRDYIRTRFPQLRDDAVRLVPLGEDWAALRRLLEQDVQAPGRQEVLRLIDSGLSPEEKERRLKKREQAYAYIKEKHLDKLRAVTVAIHVTVRGELPPLEPVDDDIPELLPVPMEPQAVAVMEEAPASRSVARRQWVPSPWYVKTNLVYDLALMPSLEIEYRINERWSAAVEGNMAWWHRDSEHWYYQLATIIPEVRYWFRPQGHRRGHYVGLFGGGGWYDLENGGRGYKGEGGLVGVSYGYQFPVGKYFAFEAGVGVGFMTTQYEEYLPIDGHYVYQQTSRTNYIGPLKLKFAFVWNIPARKR